MSESVAKETTAKDTVTDQKTTVKKETTEQTYTFTQTEVNVLVNNIAKLSYQVAAPMIQFIEGVCKKSIKPVEAVTKNTKKEIKQ